MPKIRPYSSQSCITKFRFSHSEKRRSLVGGRSVPLIPSIVERVRSGPERSRARRFLARRSATLDGEDRCETITEGWSPLSILLIHYRARIPSFVRNAASQRLKDDTSEEEELRL
jgi:hypothetical protein